MRVLVGCESSGIVREAFNARAGIHAVSCDLLPPEDGRTDYHYQGDICDILNDSWDMLIAFPPCTYLNSAGLHWNKRIAGRAAKTEAALSFVRQLLGAPIERIVLENPVGCISTRIRPADRYIQPYQFGEDASKKTGLWLKNLPLLVPTKYVVPRFVNGKPRWANQTDSGQNRLGPSPTRSTDRARTYQGIADAMAEQWAMGTATTKRMRYTPGPWRVMAATFYLR